MGHSNLEYYLHLVWATYQREPRLVGDTEEIVYACIQAELRRMKCTLLALGGVADHVHLAVQPTSFWGLDRLSSRSKELLPAFWTAKELLSSGRQATGALA